MKIELKKEEVFSTPLYFYNDESWLNKLNLICDPIIEECKKNNEQYYINNKDIGFTYHSDTQLLIKLPELEEFRNFILDQSFFILNDQGYNVELYNLLLKEFWVQEFAKDGGGHHNSHIHSNSHISGFYFLKCSNKTSFPVFHDPKLNKRMSQLFERNPQNITNSSEIINFKPKPGSFVFFNSYLEHQFVVDQGIETFRFIHFNIQALLK
jgi:uncharacterized protein (TIGR02466 family)